MHKYEYNFAIIDIICLVVMWSYIRWTYATLINNKFHLPDYQEPFNVFPFERPVTPGVWLYPFYNRYDRILTDSNQRLFIIVLLCLSPRHRYDSRMRKWRKVQYLMKIEHYSRCMLKQVQRHRPCGQHQEILLRYYSRLLPSKRRRTLWRYPASVRIITTASVQN